MKTTLLIACLLAHLAATAQDAVFRSPKTLCAALDSEGIRTEGWKPNRAVSSEWACMSPPVPFGPRYAGETQPNIAYYIRARSFDKANEIRITVNINSPGQKALAFAKLQDTAGMFFRWVGQPVPPGLMTALAQRTPKTVPTPFGQAQLEFQPGRVESYAVVLTEVRAAGSEPAAVDAGADDFTRCKVVTAMAAGYSPFSLSGDGSPAIEPGYKSFLLKGKNRDLFFCEVHSGGKYRIKAVRNGVYPFKYIAEGAF